MSDEMTPERVAAIAAAARIPIPDTSPGRIARAQAPAAARLRAENIQLALEVEPSTFFVVARSGAKR